MSGLLTIDDIRATVRFRGDYRNTLRFPDASVNTEIQAAFGELYELIADTNEGYFDTDATISTIASQLYVALPADVWRVRGLDRLDGTEYNPLAQIGIDERNRYHGATDVPRAYRLTARGADLFPTPNAIYTLRVTYTPRAPSIVSGAPSTNYYNGWEEYVIYGALLRLASNQGRDTSEWRDGLKAQIARVYKMAPQRRAAEPEYVPLREICIDPDEVWR